MLAIRNLSAGYGAFQALFDVSLEVKAGESVAVIGPNGAGKTTLLRVISKLVDIRAGEVSMEGRSLAAVPRARGDRARHRAGAGEPAPVSAPHGRRESAHGRLLPAARANFAERCERVFGLFPRLKERRSQLAGTLSGGEQQMCAIGRALMSGPKLLLLDEPSAGLAPVVVQSIFELVRKLCTQGYTVLIVEQNIRQVLKVVDRAYLLEIGRIKSSGKSAELLASDEIRKAYLGIYDDGSLRHLPPGGGAERHPAGRAARAAVARPEPHLRRHRRGVDLLRRADHDRHVRGLLAAREVRLAAARWRWRRASAWWRCWARCCTAS